MVSHSLCLAHISPTGTCEERAQPLVTSQPLATGTREERTQPLVTSQLLARGTCEEHDPPLFTMISQIYKIAGGELFPSQTGTGRHVSSGPYFVLLCTLILLLLVPGDFKEGGGFACEAPGADSHIESQYLRFGV